MFGGGPDLVDGCRGVALRVVFWPGGSAAFDLNVEGRGADFELFVRPVKNDGIQPLRIERSCEQALLIEQAEQNILCGSAG